MELWATYWALQNLGDPLLLFHHVEVLPQVRRHVPPAEVLGVALVQPVEVALLGVAAGQGQGQGPRIVPHLHQTHAFALPVESEREGGTSQLTSRSGCQGNAFTRRKRYCMCNGDSCNYWDGDKREESIVM